MSVEFHPTDPTVHNNTSTMENHHRHTIENHKTAAAHAQNLELWMGTQTWWVANLAEHAETKQLVGMRDYQWALDTLKGLVVKCLFELTSMNCAGMGKWFY